MRALSASQLLAVWEQGEDQDSTERALSLLATACPEKTREEVAALSLGRRDTSLIELREMLFADALQGFAECPRCATRLEYSVPTENLRAGSAAASEEPLALVAEGLSLRLRRPTSADLVAVRGCGEVASARRSLARRCVVEARRDGVEVAAADLPDAAIARISGFLEAADPQAELLFDLRCPSCGNGWQVVFDVAAYLWAEIDVLAKRFLREVHVLARAYGWREADILAMSAARRRCYLEMAV